MTIITVASHVHSHASLEESYVCFMFAADVLPECDDCVRVLCCNLFVKCQLTRHIACYVGSDKDLCEREHNT